MKDSQPTAIPGAIPVGGRLFCWVDLDDVMREF
jgi:hypothetical protein